MYTLLRVLRVDDVCGGGGVAVWGSVVVGKCSGGSRVRIVLGFIMRVCVSLYSSDAFVVVFLVQSNQSPRRLPAPHEWWWWLAPGTPPGIIPPGIIPPGIIAGIPGSIPAKPAPAPRPWPDCPETPHSRSWLSEGKYGPFAPVLPDTLAIVSIARFAAATAAVICFDPTRYRGSSWEDLKKTSSSAPGAKWESKPGRHALPWSCTIVAGYCRPGSARHTNTRPEAPA